jgi:hypothetical protein
VIRFRGDGRLPERSRGVVHDVAAVLVTRGGLCCRNLCPRNEKTGQYTTVIS